MHQTKKFKWDVEKYGPRIKRGSKLLLIDTEQSSLGVRVKVIGTYEVARVGMLALMSDVPVRFQIKSDTYHQAYFCEYSKLALTRKHLLKIINTYSFPINDSQKGLYVFKDGILFWHCNAFAGMLSDIAKLNEQYERNKEAKEIWEVIYPNHPWYSVNVDESLLEDFRKLRELDVARIEKCLEIKNKIYAAQDAAMKGK